MIQKLLNMAEDFREKTRQFGWAVGRAEFTRHQIYLLSPYFRRVAGLYRKYFLKRTRVIAVVGSFGKSTTARCLWAALGGDPESLSEKNFGSFLSLQLLKVRPWQRHAVIEVGIAFKGQMAPYAAMLQPDVTVVTSIGSEHNRSLGSLENTRHEKADMLRVLKSDGLAVLNGDDPNVRWMAGQTDAEKMFFGFGADNDIRADGLKIDWPDGSSFRLLTRKGAYPVKTRLFGSHMAYPILSAAATAIAEGVAPEQVVSRLASVPPMPGRLEAHRLPNGAVILRDDYKSPLETIETALDVLSEVPGRRILLIGSVEESPIAQGPMYKLLSERIAACASRVILVNPKRRIAYYRSGLRQAGFPPERVDYIRQRRTGRGGVTKAVECILKDLRPGDVILTKGRGSQRFERIAWSLSGLSIGCDIDFCRIKVFNCRTCPQRHHGPNRPAA